MISSLASMSAASGPLTSKLVIVGCSRRKADTQLPVPALELYQGGSIPWLRARTDCDTRLRSRIWVLSAAHGLVPADRPLLPYDRQMDSERAAELAPEVTATLASDWASTGRPQEVLVIAEPLYLVSLAAILATPARVHWIADLCDTAAAGSVLGQWGWP